MISVELLLITLVLSLMAIAALGITIAIIVATICNPNHSKE